jgi:hypothetical protein
VHSRCERALESCRQRRVPPEAINGHVDVPRVVVVDDVAQTDHDAVALGGQHRSDEIAPLDEHHAGSVEDLLEPEVVELLNMIEAVDVDVRDRDASFVLADDRERGTHHRLGHAEPGGDALRDRGLTGSEITAQHDDIAGPDARSDRRTDRARLGGRSGPDDHRRPSAA